MTNNYNLSQLADKANSTGNLNNITIGLTTPGAAAFTTVSATGQITSTATTGTAPLVISSTTNVPNLNASSLSGATFASPGPIGSGTASTGAFTTAAIPTITSNTVFSSTGAITLPSGTTAQEPTPTLGMIRYNSTLGQFEGYSQVNSVSGWYSVGGSSITNDTTASTAYYPLYAKATSGTAQVVYTANTEYTFKPSTGELTSPVMISSNGLSVNSSTVASSYTIQAGQNAMSVGPITVASGQSVTVSSGQRWVVL